MRNRSGRLLFAAATFLALLGEVFDEMCSPCFFGLFLQPIRFWREIVFFVLGRVLIAHDGYRSLSLERLKSQCSVSILC